MKLIFLDIDGVLNSENFYINNQGFDLRNKPFDPLCISCLQSIQNATGGQIVLTSSWRGGWSKNIEENQVEGNLLNSVFADYGLSIWDKTPVLQTSQRPLEVLEFMRSCPDMEEFLIIDDHDFQWKRYGMGHRFVQTDFQNGGLRISHIRPCVQILNKHFPIRDSIFRHRHRL